MMRYFIASSLVLHVAVLGTYGSVNPVELKIPVPELNVIITKSPPQTMPTAMEPVLVAKTARTPSLPNSVKEMSAEAKQTAEPESPSLVASSATPYTNQLKAEFQRAIREHFVYPPLAVKKGWQGRVLVALDINRDGRFDKVHVARNSAYKILDTNAVETIERIGALPSLKPYLPQARNNLVVPVHYRLNER